LAVNASGAVNLKTTHGLPYCLPAFCRAWYAKRVASIVKTYTIVLEPDPDVGGFTVLVPALPGCVTEGATLEEALANARDAISLTLEDLIARGEPIPDDAPGVRVAQVSVSLAS